MMSCYGPNCLLRAELLSYFWPNFDGREFADWPNYRCTKLPRLRQQIRLKQAGTTIKARHVTHSREKPTQCDGSKRSLGSCLPRSW